MVAIDGEAHAADPVGKSPPPRRTAVRAVLAVLVLGVAIHLLLPQVGEVDQTLHSLGRARPVFIVLAVLLSATSYVGTSLSLRSASAHRLSWSRAGHSTLAASALQAITPANIGTFALFGAVLRAAGCTVAEAASGVAANALAPVLVGAVLLVVAALLIGQLPHPQVALPAHLGLVVAVLAVLVLAGVLVVGWWLRRRHLGWQALRARLRRGLVDVSTQVQDLASEPRRAARLVGGAVVSTASYVLCLYVSVHAFGGTPGLVSCTFVYVVATAVAAVAPTPGGLGAVETAMVSGLTLLGAHSGPAVAGVLLYRLSTFWLPIPIGAVMLQRLRRKGIR